MDKKHPPRQRPHRAQVVLWMFQTLVAIGQVYQFVTEYVPWS